MNHTNNLMLMRTGGFCTSILLSKSYKSNVVIYWTRADPELIEREKKFNGQTKPIALFGMLEAPEYSRPFELRYAG